MTARVLGVEKPSRVPPRRTFESIQYLRGLAALMVVAWHAMGQMGATGPMILQSGIEVFFIVSGFVMWTISADDQQGPATFMMRRLVRVVPLYWGLTLFVATVAGVAPGLLQSIRLGGPPLAASLAFLAWPNPTPGVGLKPLLIPGWTLNYEMAFYLLVAASLWTKGWRRAFGVLAVLSGLVLIGPLLPPTDTILHFYTSPLLGDFAIGIVLAILLRSAPARANAWGGAVFTLGLVGFAAGAVIDPLASRRLIGFGLPAGLLVFGAVLWERAADRPVCKPLKALGDASYPLYLVHTLVLSALAQGWRRTPLSGLPFEAFVVLGLAVSIAVGLVLHIVLEKPLTQWFQGRLAGVLKPAARPFPVAVPGPP